MALSKSRRLSVAAAVLAAATLILSGASAEAQTEVLHYTPFNAAGKVRDELSVKEKKRKGDCYTNSFNVHRRNVFRCIAGNRLFDPCFRSPIKRRRVVCADTPWQVRVFAFRGKLPNKQHVFDGPPWALVLEGLQCTFLAGATGGSPHGRLNYACGEQAFAFGDPLVDQPTWRIWLGSQPDGSDSTLVEILQAWL